MTGKEFVRKIFSPIIWLNLLGMAVLVGIVAFATVWWMKDYTRHGVGVTVPSLKGKLISDAMIELTDLQLEGVVIDSTYSKKLAPGIVLDQTPDLVPTSRPEDRYTSPSMPRRNPHCPYPTSSRTALYERRKPNCRPWDSGSAPANTSRGRRTGCWA